MPWPWTVLNPVVSVPVPQTLQELIQCKAQPSSLLAPNSEGARYDSLGGLCAGGP